MKQPCLDQFRVRSLFLQETSEQSWHTGARGLFWSSVQRLREAALRLSPPSWAMFIVWGSGGTQLLLSCSNSPTLLLLDWLMRSTVRFWAEEVIGSTPTLPLGLWWPFCWRHVSAIIMLTDTQAYMMSPTGGSNVPASTEASYTQCPRAHAKDLIIAA